jgi:hypothetical protein
VTPSEIDRREFIRLSAAGALGLGLLSPAGAADQPPVPAKPRTPLVGIQLGAAPLAHDLDRVLDDVRQRAGVNALFPFIYSHINTWAGMPAAGFRGGNFARPHMEYYRDTLLTYEDMRAPEFGDLDLLERLLPAARQRGMKTFAWILEDNVRPPVAHWESLYEIDFHGRRTERHPSGPCYNNPHYRGFLLGLVEDYARSYAIDGIMWASEREGGLLNALGAYHNGARADPGQATCFCEFCQEKARTQGIDVARARAGFGELEAFVRNGRAGRRPRDGYYVSFWRILLNHPELLAWENLWIRSREEVQAAIYRQVKSVNPALTVGWHLWHNVSFSPFHRAEEDYAGMTAWSDFLKPVLYSNCGGERIASFIASTRQNVFGDLPADQTLAFLYHALDYAEAPYERVTAAGLSPDYVRRETRRTLAGVAGTATQVWPGIDIDVPVGPGASRCTPGSVKQTVMAAFNGGAHGVLLSRSYSEMNPENLAGAGAALRELGLM